MKKKTINFPALEEINEEYTGEYILDLYRAIGWGKNMDLNPKHIFINEDQWLEICSAFNATGISGAGFTWMNFGPTGDKAIPYGKISIHPGAFTVTEVINQ